MILAECCVCGHHRMLHAAQGFVQGACSKCACQKYTEQQLAKEEETKCAHGQVLTEFCNDCYFASVGFRKLPDNRGWLHLHATTARTAAANYLAQVQPQPPAPGCHVCSAAMVPAAYVCRACGTTTRLSTAPQCVACGNTMQRTAFNNYEHLQPGWVCYRADPVQGCVICSYLPDPPETKPAAPACAAASPPAQPGALLRLWRWLRETCPYCGAPLQWHGIAPPTWDAGPTDMYGTCAEHGEVR